MVSIAIREDLSLFDDAFSIHVQIPEFQVDSDTSNQLKERISQVKQPVIFCCLYRSTTCRLFDRLRTLFYLLYMVSRRSTKSSSTRNLTSIAQFIRTMGNKKKLLLIGDQNSQLF